MRELVIISGKGGTGKTSLTAALAALAKPLVLADCDVDAADLHLLVSPQLLVSNDFTAGHLALIRQADCINCGKCAEVCRFNAVNTIGEKPQIDPIRCEGCGVCVHFCPSQAIEFPERHCGEWYQSMTRYGPMLHAQLDLAAENSGKLVTLLRQEARKIAKTAGIEWILVDGPPGIGCPVIASINAADAAVVVIDSTISGLHDLLRVLELTLHFDIPAFLVVNRWDINPVMADKIETEAKRQGAMPLGRIRSDPLFTGAMIRGESISEYAPESITAREILRFWKIIVEKVRSER